MAAWLRANAQDNDGELLRLKRNLRLARQEALTARQRQLLRMNFEQNKTVTEIAQELGVETSPRCPARCCAPSGGSINACATRCSPRLTSARGRAYNKKHRENGSGGNVYAAQSDTEPVVPSGSGRGRDAALRHRCELVHCPDGTLHRRPAGLLPGRPHADRGGAGAVAERGLFGHPVSGGERAHPAAGVAGAGKGLPCAHRGVYRHLVAVSEPCAAAGGAAGGGDADELRARRHPRRLLARHRAHLRLLDRRAGHPRTVACQEGQGLTAWGASA